MNGPAWRLQVQKLHIYEEIFTFNRAFHGTLLSLERLENLGFFRSEYPNACKIELEHRRANANDGLIETLREYERRTKVAVSTECRRNGRISSKIPTTYSLRPRAERKRSRSR